MKRILMIFAMVAMFPFSQASEPMGISQDAQCAFQDEAFMRHLGIITLTAQFYLDCGRWPKTPEELQALPIPDVEPDQIEARLAVFERIEWQESDDDVILTYSLPGDNNSTTNQVHLRPGKTLTAIIQSAENVKEPARRRTQSRAR